MCIKSFFAVILFINTKISVIWLRHHIFISVLCIKIKEVISLKATGVVRRIDDLGRVVIPKEIRKTLRIKEGDPLETTLEQLRVLTESLKLLAS